MFGLKSEDCTGVAQVKSEGGVVQTVGTVVCDSLLIS